MATDSSALVVATDLEVRYNEQVVLNKASLAIGETDRMGIVGRNGAGKSTFLRILAGEQDPDSGKVVRRRALVTGYLPQNFTLDPEKTVYEAIHAGAARVLSLIQEFEALPPESARHEEIERAISALDGWNLENRIEVTMDHLNAPRKDIRIGTLSGGEKRRVAMCQAIISRPDLLILDEPTNHLDPESIEWLEEFLENFSGAFLVVTHDRHFLDRVTNCIVELANGAFYSYRGNYSTYLTAKTERQATEDLIEHKRQSFLRRELEWVRRGPPARTTKSKSRLDNYYDIAAQERPPVEGEIDLVIPPPPPLGNRIVDLVNVGIELGAKSLIENLTFSFEAGMRIGVAGRNGAGKTSLLRMIIGELAPTTGSVKTGSLTKFNYVDQARLLLNDNKTVFEEIADGTEFVVFGNGRLSLRAYLKRFLFTDDRINTLVRYLSGGERSRLLLARILKNGGNFLVMDEPTNDLDLSTLQILEEALIAFPGCVLVVSHDRYFLNRICTGILAFEGHGRVHYNVGNYDYYKEQRQKRMERQTHPAPETQQSGGSKVESKPRKLSWKETQELAGIETEIEKTDAEIARIEALFASPDFHRNFGQETSKLTLELDEQKIKVTRLFERWQELDSRR